MEKSFKYLNKIYWENNTSDFVLTMYLALNPNTNEEEVVFYKISNKSQVLVLPIDEFDNNYSLHTSFEGFI